MVPIRTKSIWKAMLLSLVTLGIYAIYWTYLLVKNVRALRGDDSGCVAEMLCLIFVPFYSIYWWYTRGETVTRAIGDSGKKAYGSAVLYLLLSIFGFGSVCAAVMQNDLNNYAAKDEPAKETGVIPVNRRNLAEVIFLSLITLGIYQIYWTYITMKNVKAILGDDPSCKVDMLAFFLIPGYSIYWWHVHGKRVSDEFAARGHVFTTNTVLFTVFGALGLDIVALALMQKNFNTLLSGSYSIRIGSEKWKPWLYLSPALILLAVFTVWPIINTIRMAFLENYSGLQAAGGATFNFGFGNFAKVIQYRRFKDCLRNTVLLCVLTVPISTFLALLIAVCLNSIKPLQRFLQTIFFLPYVTNSIAIGMVFAAMFNIVGSFFGTENEVVATAGVINNFLGLFGIEKINWINAGSTYIANMTVMVVYIVWNALPFKILVLLGGLQGINKQYYEAAKVDGTSRIRTFGRITVPLLSPMLAYVVITGFIGGFKEYTSIVGIFGEAMGPPDDAGRLNTMVGFIYDALSGNHHGRASAAALILFGIILVVTLINLRVSKKKTHY